MTQDIFYIDDNYFEQGYYVYTADAESQIASTCELISQVNVIVDAVSTIQITFTANAVLSNLYGADLFAFTDAQLETAVDRIRDNNLNVSCAYTITADAERTRWISGSLDSIADILFDFERVRYDEAAIDAAFSFTEQSQRVRYNDSSINSSFTLDSQGGYLQDASFVGNIVSSLNSSPTVISPVSINCDLFVTSNLTANVEKVIYFSSNLDSSVEISEAVSKNTNIFLPLEVEGFSIIVDAKQAAGVANLESSVVFFVDAIKFTDTNLSLENNFNINLEVNSSKEFRIVALIDSNSNIDASKTVNQEINLLVEGFEFTTAFGLKPSDSQLFVISDITVNAIKLVRATSYLQVDAATLDVVIKTARGDVHCEINSTMSINAKITRRITLPLTSRFTFRTDAIETARASLTAFSNAHIVANISIIHIEPYLTWDIKPDVRTQTILGDIRLWDISKDNRIYSLRQETRNHIIQEETRIHTNRR